MLSTYFYRMSHTVGQYVAVSCAQPWLTPGSGSCYLLQQALNPPNTSRHVIISCFTVPSVCLIDRQLIEKSQLYKLLIKSRGFVDIYYGAAIDRGHAVRPLPSATEKQIWPCWHISQCSPDRLIKSHWCPPAWENGFIFRGIHPQGEKLRLMAFCALLQFAIVFVREIVCSRAMLYMQMWPGSA